MEKKDKILGYTKTGIPYGFQGAVFPHAMFPALERAVRACLFPFTHLLYKKFFKGQFFFKKNIRGNTTLTFLNPKLSGWKTRARSAFSNTTPIKCS